tara:strand:+ start:7818 stop:8084 length:267 start_codon:yes stop_codon:yes gene_type:complete
MTADQAAARQAAHENSTIDAIFSARLRPDTLERIESILTRVRKIDGQAFAAGDLDAFRALGTLYADAFAALTAIQTDRNVTANLGVRM